MESFADLFALVLENCKGKMSEVAFSQRLNADRKSTRLNSSHIA